MTEKNLPHTISSVNDLFVCSFHPVKNPGYSGIVDFNPVSIELNRFRKMITGWVWSPSQFKTNKRNKENFLQSSVLALDFDNGKTTIDDAVAICGKKDVDFIIGTSKSHQKEKPSAKEGERSPRDRFRLIFPMNQITDSIFVYENTLKIVASWFDGVDPAPVHCASYFSPCVEIVHESVTFEKTIKWEGDHEKLKSRIERNKLILSKKAAFNRKNKTIPKWVWEKLECGVNEGARNRTVYGIAIEFAQHGIDQEKALEILMGSKLAEIGEKNVRKGIKSGYAFAQRNGF